MASTNGKNREEIKVIKWVSWDEANEMPAAVDLMGGFFNNGMRWEDYRKEMEEPIIPYLEALRAEIVSRQIKQCGYWHQQGEAGVPVFSDGTTALFSLRAWGDLMAAIWSTEEDIDYSYVDFAWSIPGDD